MPGPEDATAQTAASAGSVLRGHRVLGASVLDELAGCGVPVAGADLGVFEDGTSLGTRVAGAGVVFLADEAACVATRSLSTSTSDMSSSFMGIAYPVPPARTPARWPWVSELWEALLAADARRQRVAVLSQTLLDVVDGPTVRPEPVVVEVIPGDRHRHRRA